MSTIRFAIDTGGTFTDIVVLDESDGRFFLMKSPTTPENTLRGVLNVIEKAGINLATTGQFFIHGSTTALNALLERKGVRTAFVTTEGFRDVPEIARYNRPDMYNPRYHKPAQIVPRHLRYGVRERVNTHGQILTALDEEDVRRVGRLISKQQVRAIAVCTLHAFTNPVHERRIREILLEECAGVSVTISSDVVAEHREYERGMTTILNAYLAPVVEKWVGELEAALRDKGFKGEVVLIRSDGGGMSSDAAKRSPINTLLSGPSGGLIGGLFLSSIGDYPNLITTDLGGTSYDVGIIKNREASTSQETKACGYPLLMPNLDIRAIAAGGGSIAWMDEAGALHVGPQSAGAKPGPMCYNQGGVEPTVTDALVCNGYMNPKNFLGGTMPLNADRSRAGIQQKVCDPLNLSLAAGASGILRIALSNMAEAIKNITSESGDDPRDFALLCYGGGGPIFGGYLMNELSIPTAIVPIAPSAFSAWGMLMVDLRYDVARTVTRKLEQLNATQLNDDFGALIETGSGLLKRDGVAAQDRQMYRSIDMRYSGQEHTVSVPVEFDLGEGDAQGKLYAAFEKVYENVYGYKLGLKGEIVNVRIKAIGRLSKPTLKEIQAGGTESDAAFTEGRRVFDLGENTWMDFKRYDRTKLLARNVVVGPAIVEEATTLTVIPRGQTCTVDRFGNLVLKWQ